jgi:hypothetical protein
MARSRGCEGTSRMGCRFRRLWALFHVLPRIAHVAGNAPLSQHNKILRTAKEFGDIPYATLNGLDLYRADARRAGVRSSIARLVACARNRFVGGGHTDPEGYAANDAGVTETDLIGELVRACTHRKRHVRRLDYARRPTSAGRSRLQSMAAAMSRARRSLFAECRTGRRV